MEAEDPVLRQHSPGNINTYFVGPLNPVQLVFGSHGSGKTTYCLGAIKLCLLAYIGCALPVKYSSVPLFNKVVTLMHSGEDLEEMTSSFGAELHQINNCLELAKNPKEKKLVYIDNFCCSSSFKDNFAHARAMLELLLLKNCLVYVSSNDYNYAVLSKVYPTVACHQMKCVEAGNNRLSYQISPLTDFKVMNQTSIDVLTNMIVDTTMKEILKAQFCKIRSLVTVVNPDESSLYMREFLGFCLEFKIEVLRGGSEVDKIREAMFNNKEQAAEPNSE